MPRLPQRLTVTLLVVAAVIADATLYFLRCPASPPVNFNALAVALVVQGVAVLLAYWGTDTTEETSQIFLRPVLGFGVALFFISLPMAQYALNYSDALGRPNWFKSVGQQCRGK